MALTLQISSLRQVTVLVCQGIIVFGEEADSLRAQVKELLRQNEPSAPGPSVVPGLYLVLDLSRVLYIDSGGLGALVGLLTSIRAAGGLEGLERLSCHEFDVVLLDVWMPHMNGLDVLTELHRRGSTQRVILMTADHAPETLLHAVREQASQYISKPFSSEELLATVQKVLACPVQPAIEVLSAKPDWVQLLVPCHPEVLDRIQPFLMGLDSDLPHQGRDTLGQAFHELLLNAIEWGGKVD